MSRHSFVSSALAEERRTASDGIVKGGNPLRPPSGSGEGGL